MTQYKKPASIIPPHDEERLQKLYGYEILDTPPEQAFDKLAKLAAQIFETPGAYISFVDRDRVFLKSNLSAQEGNEVLRKDSLCSLSILEEQVTVFNDTHQIPDLLESPLVACEGGIRFYAGAPLKTSEGYQLGTICVVDAAPREATEKQLKMLEALASVVVDELEHRLSARKSIRVQTDLLNITAHDLKNPTINILLLADLLLKKSAGNGFTEMVADKIKSSADDIIQKLEGLLHLSLIENSEFEITLENFNLCELLQSLKSSFELQAQQKQQSIDLDCNPEIIITADRKRLKEVFENLLSNAIKYSHVNTRINVSAWQREGEIFIEFKDQGQGLTPSDKKKLFTKFAQLSARPTGKERSNKLGLSIVKTLVELHQGKVWAESEGKGKGSTFCVCIPVKPADTTAATKTATTTLPAAKAASQKVKF